MKFYYSNGDTQEIDPDIAKDLFIMTNNYKWFFVFLSSIKNLTFIKLFNKNEGLVLWVYQGTEQ